jgi:TolA-binding protein
MDDFFAKVVLAIALAGAAPPAHASADAGDDQYAVAAGHYARDRWKLAIEEFAAFRRDFSRHPKANQAIFFQAEANMQIGEFAAAGKLFREFLESDPENRYRRQTLFRIAEASYMRGENASARDELEEFRAEYPDDRLNAYVLCYLGEIELADKRWREAAALFSRCLKEFPQGRMQDDCRFGLARALEQQGDRDEAQRLFLALSGKTASELADDAMFRLAALQYDRGDYNESLATLAEFEKEFAQSKLLDRVRLSRGWALYRLDRLDEAQRVFESLADAKTVAIDARYWLGLTLKARRQWQSAAKTLGDLATEKLAEVSSDLPAIVYHAGDAARLAEQYDDAARHFNRVLDRHQRSDWVDDALLGLMQIAWEQRNHGEIDRLAGQFDREFVKSSLADDVQRLLAQSLVDRKQFDKAAAILEPLSDRDNRAADRYLLALAYQGLQRNRQALELLKPLATEGGSLAADALQAEAALLIAEQQFAEAIGPLTQYLRKHPDESAADQCRAQLVVCYGRTGELAKARRTWDDLLAAGADSSLLNAATQHLAEAHYSKSEYAAAAELFQRLTTGKQPEDVLAKGLSGLGWSRYRLDQFDQSAAAFQQLVKQYPRHLLAPESALVHGQICEKLEQPQQALASYRQIIENYHDSNQRSQAMLAAARILDRRNDNRQANEQYAQLLAEYPKETFVDAALYERAWVLRELKDEPSSLAQFERLHKDFSDSRFWSDATFRMAEHAYAEKRYGDAEKLLAALVDRQPDQGNQPHVLFLQGQLAAATQQWAETAEAMQQLVERHPDHALRSLAEYWVAESHYRRGKHDEAQPRLTLLAEQTESQREPWMAMIPLRRAQILAGEKKWKEAQQLAVTIAERFPNFDQLYEADYVIGRAYASRGEFESARSAYQKVIRSEQGGKTETAAMAQWMIGETYFHQKNYEAALREYLRVEILYDYPEWQAAALLQAGKCQEQLGQWRQAADLYERLVKDFSTTSYLEEAQRRLKSAQQMSQG